MASTASPGPTTIKADAPQDIGIIRVHHVNFYVNDIGDWANYFIHRMNFREVAHGGPYSGKGDRVCRVVGHGRIRFILTQAAYRESVVAGFLRKHPQGVADIAFLVHDAATALEECARRGATVVAELESHHFERGRIRFGSIAAYGDVTHTLIDVRGEPPFGPGYHDISDAELKQPDPSGSTFAIVDHMVANVPAGEMDRWVEFYERVFGFKQTRHFDIRTKRSALMSKVLTAQHGYIQMPINEPSSENSQIQEYLNANHGPGVQHIALLTKSIISTIDDLRRRGMSFLSVPDEYFDMASARVGPIDETMEELRRTGILVDRENNEGYLLQLFTKPVFAEPTLFFEIIQRHGLARGFGEGNFRALFEAIEREQMNRGTL
ncbi:MAG: 4-hydroxyphenylpyruvate dioxygenase [Gemmataceae bacterium]|nr:4-hydroxyphenylpyruvate dioxygenase [Gemmataceae bacterium]